jgi:hypothetical protein
MDDALGLERSAPPVLMPSLQSAHCEAENGPSQSLVQFAPVG